MVVGIKQRKILARNLRMLRVGKKVSQEFCARAVNVSLRTWRRWETAESYPMEIYRPAILKILPELKKI